MGQRYEGTLIIQTSDYYSPVGSKNLMPVGNPASSDDVALGKGLYNSNGSYVNGSFVDGWPIEISTEEDMDAFATLGNVGRYAKYTGTSSGTSGPSVPTNPINVGDTITKLYFNTKITPNFSNFDWSGASAAANGYKILVLLGGTSAQTTTAELLVVEVYPKGFVFDEGEEPITFTSDQYTISAGNASPVVYATEQFANALGASFGWQRSFVDAGFNITSVSQQDIWGEYISKDGQWTSGTTSKYTSGQIYQVIQQGESAELKPIQY